jgi:competence protein ComEC
LSVEAISIRRLIILTGIWLTIIVASISICGCHAPVSPTPSPAATHITAFGEAGNSDLPDSSSILTVHFIDVGQGDSILVMYGNKTILIDGGRPDAGPALSSYLKKEGVSAIDVMVSTHPHADHIGGLLTVLRKFPVKKVVDSGQPHSSRTYEQYLTLIDEKNIQYTVAERGQYINFSPAVTVQVLSPPPAGLGGDLNQNSIVLKLIYGNVSFLFMGDAGFAAERNMMATHQGLNSTVLKVGHHGTKYATSRVFLHQVKPEISVIEVGTNKYGHPAPQLLQRLEEAGSKVYRTDINGDIVIATDGTTYSVSTQHPGQEASRDPAVFISMAISLMCAHSGMEALA